MVDIFVAAGRLLSCATRLIERIMNIVPVSAWCFVFSYIGAVSVQAQHYVEITAVLASRTPTTSYNWTAKCIVGTNSWHIMVGGVEWLFDGSKLAEKLVDLHKDSSCYGCYTVDIYPSDRGYTLGDYSANVPWLAFCSGAYLKRNGRIIPLPLDYKPIPNAPDAFAYSDTTRVFEDDLGLPQTVDLFTSEALLKASIMSDVFLGKHDLGLWKRGSMGLQFGNVPDGRLKFHYRVTQSTNYSGWNIPLQFECVASRLTANNEWVSDWTVTGRVTSMGLSDRPTVEGLADGKPHTVLDWRFKDARSGITALPYRTTNSDVSSTNDPLLQERFTIRVARAHIPVMTPRRFRVVFIIFLLLITAIPLAILARRKSKYSTQL